MRRVLSRILQGNYTSEDLTLDFSCSRIELDVPAGEEYEGSFHIYSSSDIVPEGKVISSDLRMVLINDTITGSDSEITYRLEKDYCSEGDAVKGVFSVISSMGEYYIPFIVNIVRPVPESSIGPIKNLFHFTNLARADWKEAVNLFYSKNFPYVIADADTPTKLAYKALSAQRGNEMGVEEFLIFAGKKNKVFYSFRNSEININITSRERSGGLKEVGIEISRDGWGYTHLNIRCEGEFLFTETKTLNENDFSGNICPLKLFVDPSGCAPGLHPGKIILFNTYTELEIPVSLSVGGKPQNAGSERSRKALFVKVTDCYIRNMLGEGGGSAFIAEQNRLVEQMLTLDEYDITAKLMQAHLLLIQGRDSEAEWTCGYASELLEKNEGARALNSRSYVLDAAYLDYLRIRTGDERASKRSRKHLEEMAKRFRDDWRVRWLYAKVRYEENGDVSAMWDAMKHICDEGCNSPVIYAEGAMLLKDEVSLIAEPDRYTLQTILFGLKKNVLGEDVKENLLYISGRSRTSIPLLLRNLELMYSVSPDNRVLEEICSQLIRSFRRDKESALWYKRAALEDIKLTNLYENYVMSLDEDSFNDIPMNVLKYFSMSDTLDPSHTASLYHYVIRHRKELGPLVDVYLPKMESFAMDQIGKGIITRHLAALYYEVVSPASLDRNNARIFADMLFSVWLQISDPKYVKAYVYQKGFKHPWEYKLGEGGGWVSVYGSDYIIALEDASGNRYIKSCEYTLEKLMLSGKFMKAVADCVYDNDRFNINILSSIKGEDKVDPGNILRYQNLSASSQLERHTADSYLLKLLDYFAQNSDRVSLVNGLKKIEPVLMTPESRCEIMRLMLQTGDYGPIYDLIKSCGPYFADPRYMQTFLDRQLLDVQSEDPYLTASAIYCISLGKKDGIILKYLSSYYRGQCKDLRNIWKMSGGYGVDRRLIEERMLIQMLYSGAFVGERNEIFEDYLTQEPDPDVVKAFLLQSCYDYFVHEKLISPSVFAELDKLEQADFSLPKEAGLAYLKYYSESPKEITDEIRVRIIALLSAMMKERIHLGMFQSFLSEESFPEGELRTELLEVMDVMSDRTVIDYRATEGGSAVIHYTFAGDQDEDAGYKEERMRNVCGGVCFKEFVLFFGECVQYYITEETSAGSELRTSGVLRKNDVLGPAEGSRFGLISDMLVSNTLQDYETFDKLYDEYYKKEFLNRKLFRLE
ncbi:MAG: DUF5717 family protein [Lachnospiraceae bacterium]|nr:DUF5717 family protein [Lachnospiraceae bacterium]